MSRSKTASKSLPSYATLESLKGKKDTFTRISESLITSDAFQDLKPHEQLLYIAMREQEIGKHRPVQDFDESSPLWEAVKSDNCFYFSWHTSKKYAKRYINNSGRLYKDINSLVSHGFIEIVSSGQSTRTKSIYKFSSKWKTWKKI